jgi:deoxyribonuclease I
LGRIANDDILQNHLDELRLMQQGNSDLLVKECKENQRRILSDKELYYDELEDQLWLEEYYRGIYLEKEESLGQLKKTLHQTHKYRQPYYISKDQYLYTWVDLQPYGELKNIYSGKHANPENVIKADFEIISQRFEKYRELIEAQKHADPELIKHLRLISRQHKFNVEHVVPQSWYRAAEPMKGDLHHMFTCEPKCNRVRSNFFYHEFPKGSKSVLKYEDCGVYDGISRFEPEYGKGIAARATLYFLLRYPGVIEKRFRKKINFQLLLKWHRQFPVTLYEKHRNKAVFEIQGNRNPYIDFPELAEKTGLWTL